MYEDFFQGWVTENYDGSEDEEVFRENEAFKITEWRKVSHDI